MLIEPGGYKRVIPLIGLKNELSLYSVLLGNMPGKVYADDRTKPSSALVKAYNCNFLAGKPDNNDFNREIYNNLGFWDQLTFDNPWWEEKLAEIHPNKYLRKYKRRRYVLCKRNHKSMPLKLPEGFVLKKVLYEEIIENKLLNHEKLINWIDDWGNRKAFEQNGCGAYIATEKAIVSWSLADCFTADGIEIGVQTDEKYRRRGFGAAAANETIKECFKMGYKKIYWGCTDFNKGSIAIAERLGFPLAGEYCVYTPYPPAENLLDFSGNDWLDWALYYENAAKDEPRLLYEQLYAFIKANNLKKALKTLESMKKNKVFINCSQIVKDIEHFKSLGMCSNFTDFSSLITSLL